MPSRRSTRCTPSRTSSASPSTSCSSWTRNRRPRGAGTEAWVEPLETTLPHDPVQRAASRSKIRLGSGVVWERLTTESIRNVDFLHVTYEVGGESSPADAFQRHSGQEWGYVLSGTLMVRIGFDEFLLQPGDAITFDSGHAASAVQRR